MAYSLLCSSLQVLEDYYHVSPLFIPDKVAANKKRYTEKRRVGKSRKKDEQLSDIINLKIMFIFFDGLGLFSLPT